MKIDQSMIRQSSVSEYKEKTVETESLRKWSDNGAIMEQFSTQKALEISISSEARSLSVSQMATIDEDEAYLSKDEILKLRVLEKMLSKLTGREVKFRIFRLDLQEKSEPELNLDKLKSHSRHAEQKGEQLEGWGIDYQYKKEYVESEVMSYRSTGVVKTTDGKEITFDISLNMSRTFSESTEFRFKAGDALKDPLVVELGSSSIGLSHERMKFDIDFDGKMDEIPILNQNSGFIVYDKNQNDRLDDGSELFGAKTGEGFKELAVLDSDQNGWIDENDQAFDQIKIWVSDGTGKGNLVGLIDADVGALFVGGIDTAYHLKNNENDLLGMIRKTSTYLKESGGAGVIHQIDLKV